MVELAYVNCKVIIENEKIKGYIMCCSILNTYFTIEQYDQLFYYPTRFHVENATWLSSGVKTKILEKYGSQLTKDGWMVVKSDRTR